MASEQQPPVVFHRKFTRPRVKVYRAADRGVRFGWNRYDTATIGCGIVLPTFGRSPGAWCLSLVWARPIAEHVTTRSQR
jgi:hypothetical protein